MNTETIIAELERFQKRFAGGDSKTIDAAVTSLRSLVASNATLRNQRTRERLDVVRNIAEPLPDDLGGSRLAAKPGERGFDWLAHSTTSTLLPMQAASPVRWP